MTLNGEVISEYVGPLLAFLASHSIQRAGIAIAIDGQIVPKSEWSTTSLTGTESIEIVAAAAGG